MSTASLADLRSAVTEAAASLASNGAGGGDASGARVERPKREGQGDYSTNLAMLLAPTLRKAPREIAEQVGTALSEVLASDLVRFEVAGPGFVNLFLSDDWYRRALRTVLDAGERFGAGGAPVTQQVLVEFVSANPTGPLVAASGRHAAYGDALSRVLAHHGHQVWREYYFNDAGGQIERLGQSVLARARGEDPPEDGYQGEYVADLAAQIPGAESMDSDQAAAHAVELLLAQIKATLERYGVHYDQYFSERTLHEGSPSYVERGLEVVAEGGHSYESEGALWLRSTTFGDDKDRVLRRSDGAPTYLAADVGYLLQKRERGVQLQLLPVGADHHGYVARMKAAWAALGGDPGTLEMPIIQFVHLVAGAERAAMSKRRGEFITLDDLLDEIGVDATRYWMLQRSHDRTVDLDLALAKEQSPDNPVYYVQYAHARIVSILGRLSEDRVAGALAGGADWAGGALEHAERNLIKALVAFPDEIAEAAERRAPHRIAGYVHDLAQEFSAFYRDCKVVGAEPEATESFRIALCQATRQTIKLALWLLGVSAPDSM